MKSLISLLDTLELAFTGGTMYTEIERMREIYKRKYINTDVELDGMLDEVYDDEAELINSWRPWYIYTTTSRKKKK